MTQRVSSAGTSVNTVPAVIRMINKLLDHPIGFWVYVSDVLDFGGGRYEKLTELLASMGIRNWVYDPYNRSPEHNQLVLQQLGAQPADLALCSNVLNVIREPSERRKAMLKLRELTKNGEYVFFTVYEGDRSSRGRRTSKGWQANRPTRSYLREIRAVFPDAQLFFNKLIVATVQKDDAKHE